MVEWVDSWSSDHANWKPIGELDEDLTPCRSVGWVAAETSQSLIIVPHLDRELDDGNTFGALGIPKVAILSVVELRPIES